MTTTLKAAYGVSELAAMAGLSRFQVHRLLVSRKVPTTEIGKKVLVPLVGFKMAFPEIWDSIVVRLSLPHTACVVCEVCGSQGEI